MGGALYPPIINLFSMKTIYFSMLFIFTFSCIAINKVESRKGNDGSTSIKPQEYQYLHDFDMKKRNMENQPNQFQYINATQLCNMAKQSKYTVVVIWGSWCPVCHTYLSKMRSWKDSLSAYYPDVDLVLVVQNVNITYSQEVLRKSNYPYLTYIINPADYGTDELKKQDGFLAELKSGRKKTEGGVPSTVILNSSGIGEYEVAGKKVTLAMLISKMNL